VEPVTAIEAAAVALLHPGEMGAAIGGVLRDTGTTVRWVSEGRSPATRARAEAAGLTEIESVVPALEGVDIVLVVCPPAFALEVARTVAVTGFAGTYVDANAIAPATAREVAKVVNDAGATFIDGGIVGPPPSRAGTTRFFLSGPSWPTAVIADLFASTPVQTVVVSDEPGDASAVKIAYAAWTKGSAALLVAAREYAARAGVDTALLAEWERSQPGLADRADASRAHAGPKAWRWVAEMLEIADAFEEQGLPPGFHQAAAKMYDDLA
jgi:3-hydroxyisobutyrate dehydrogenase-like beta-hydroxyacid dehydrogenase